MQRQMEAKKELCTIASKIVRIKIYRDGTGCIVDFECDAKSASCDSRCTYKMLMEDF